MSMIRRAIVAFVPLLSPEPIATLRRRFDPLAERVRPHLTLVFPFESTLPAEPLRQHIAEAVRGLAPFPVRLASVTGHEGAYLFLNVKHGNDALIELHDRLYTGPLQPYLSREHTFTPHLTIGRLADADAFHAALAVVTAAEIHIDTLISTVSVYVIEPDGARPIETKVSLSGEG